jgi:hypothetical protein
MALSSGASAAPTLIYPGQVCEYANFEQGPCWMSSGEIPDYTPYYTRGCPYGINTSLYENYTTDVLAFDQHPVSAGPPSALMSRLSLTDGTRLANGVERHAATVLVYDASLT